MRSGLLNVVLDLQWGSTGKGKLCGWLALSPEGLDVATCDFQTNAGHTVITPDGRKFVLQQLPVAVVNPETRLLVNPGATISVPKLLEEVETHKAQNRLKIHPNAAIVTDKAVAWERENLKRISSTLKGVGATLGLKTMRSPDTVLAKDVPELHRWIADTTEILHGYLRAGARCLAEGAQGFDLSLNHGREYPFVTSRDITPASILSNAGVPPQLVGDVYGCLRTYPIRVGHQYEKNLNPGAGQPEFVKVGDSGPMYSDQIELTWEELEKESGAKHSLIEKTTVTQKVRRVFTFSRQQLKRAIQVCMPTHLFVNFINHVDAADEGKRTYGELSPKSREFLNMVDGVAYEDVYKGVHRPVITHIGTGPGHDEIVVIE